LKRLRGVGAGRRLLNALRAQFMWKRQQPGRVGLS